MSSIQKHINLTCQSCHCGPYSIVKVDSPYHKCFSSHDLVNPFTKLQYANIDLRKVPDTVSKMFSSQRIQLHKCFSSLHFLVAGWVAFVFWEPPIISHSVRQSVTSASKRARSLLLEKFEKVIHDVL